MKLWTARACTCFHCFNSAQYDENGKKKQLKVIFLFYIPLLLHLRSYCICFLFCIDVLSDDVFRRKNRLTLSLKTKNVVYSFDFDFWFDWVMYLVLLCILMQAYVSTTTGNTRRRVLHHRMYAELKCFTMRYET